MSTESKSGLRNQNSANLSSLKQNGHISQNGSQNQIQSPNLYSNQSGNQRVRDKLLINSGGLTLGQNNAGQTNALLMQKNGQNAKSPPGKTIEDFSFGLY